MTIIIYRLIWAIPVWAIGSITPALDSNFYLGTGLRGDLVVGSKRSGSSEGRAVRPSLRVEQCRPFSLPLSYLLRRLYVVVQQENRCNTSTVYIFNPIG